MELGDYINRVSRVYSLNKILLVVVGIMSLATIYAISSIKGATKNQTTIVVPMSAQGPVAVGQESASDEYLISMARDIINLAFTYSATNARQQFEQLLLLYAPEVREVNRRKLINLADKIEAVKRVTRSFYIDRIEATPEKITVKGQTVRRLGQRLETEHAAIEIGYRIQYGRFMIEYMKRVDGVNGRRPKPKSVPVDQAVNLDKGGNSILEGVEDGIR